VKPKFTPAPWHVKDRHSEEPTIWYVKPENTDNFYWRDIVTTYANQDDEMRANTFLIAAAPELYEALERAYVDAIRFLNEGDFKRHVEWDAGYIVDALAKARGETKL
jgi:parvulin-like peptidyl-prolyl isomerase